MRLFTTRSLAAAACKDGKVLVNTSETTNMAHFIDTTTFAVIDNVLVDARPRFAEDVTVAVRQVADRFRAARVDPEDVHPFLSRAGYYPLRGAPGAPADASFAGTAGE